MIVPLEMVIGRHTEEIQERVETNLVFAEAVTGVLTQRERQIFEMGFGSGYMLGSDEEKIGEAVEVLKEENFF